MDSSIKFLTTVYISFSVAQHDVTHHPAYQPELLSSRTVSNMPNDNHYAMEIGSVLAQAVSCLLLTAEARVRAQGCPCGFLVDREALGQIFFSELFGVPLSV
jgi:hypothetical protein